MRFSQDKSLSFNELKAWSGAGQAASSVVHSLGWRAGGWKAPAAHCVSLSTVFECYPMEQLASPEWAAPKRLRWK